MLVILRKFKDCIFLYFLNDTVTSVSVKVCCIFMEDSFKIKDKFFKLICSLCLLYLYSAKMILKV